MGVTLTLGVHVLIVVGGVLPPPSRPLPPLLTPVLFKGMLLFLAACNIASYSRLGQNAGAMTSLRNV